MCVLNLYVVIIIFFLPQKETSLNISGILPREGISVKVCDRLVIDCHGNFLTVDHEVGNFNFNFRTEKFYCLDVLCESCILNIHRDRVHIYTLFIARLHLISSTNIS